MINVLFIVLIFASFCFGEGPIYKHKQREVNLEFQNVYQDYRSILKDGQLPSKTLTEIRASTASATGKLVYCSNCATTPVCVSTGTTQAGQFTSPSSRATACQ